MKKSFTIDTFVFCGTFREKQEILIRHVLLHGANVTKSGLNATVIVIPDSIKFIESKLVKTFQACTSEH